MCVDRQGIVRGLAEPTNDRVGVRELRSIHVVHYIVPDGEAEGKPAASLRYHCLPPLFRYSLGALTIAYTSRHKVLLEGTEIVFLNIHPTAQNDPQ